VRARRREGGSVIWRMGEGVLDMGFQQLKFQAIPIRPALGFQSRVPIGGFAFGCLSLEAISLPAPVR
jgi:hypothetical protein